MRGLFLSFTFVTTLLGTQAHAAEARMKSRAQRPSCAALCAQLGNVIRAHPDKLVMAVEDALVINESCTREIISMAIDVAHADPGRVRQIYEAAVKVVPHRRDEVWQAVRRFSVPAARPMREPALEVRRARLPDSNRPAVIEIRRAQSPQARGKESIPEIRRAIVPTKQ